MDCQTIIIDNGSYEMKAGFAESTTPELVFPNIIGFPRSKEGSKTHLIGDEVMSSSDPL